jgi:hypothetical protein
MATTIYERLSLNFDTTKFGNVNVLGQKTIDYYNQFPDDLKDWQYDTIVNSDAGKQDYFQNPLSTVCDDLKVVVDDLSNISLDVVFENNPATGNLIYSTAVTTSSELIAFKSHTNNISGSSTESMSTANVPSYDMVLSVGNEIQRIVTKKEEIANSSPFLGSLTSLFIGDDLDVYFQTITSDKEMVNNSIRIETFPDPEDPELTISVEVSNLSSLNVNSVYSNINSLYTLINTRRLEDWSFYVRSRDILNDYFFVKRFDNIGNTQTNLINNYIGTEKLKNIIANT